MKKIKNIVFNKTTLQFVLMFISFFSIAIFTNGFTKGLVNIDTYGFNNLRCKSIYIGFSLSWIILLLLIIYLVPKKKRILVYSIIEVLLNILLFSQISYVRSLGKFMMVSDLFLAGEGLQYAKGAFVNIPVGMLLVILFNILLITIINIIDKKMVVNANKNKSNKINIKVVVVLIFLIIVSRLVSFTLLGNVAESNTWHENYNTKNIYNNFSNPNSSMFVTGFYEYHVRAIYKYFYNIMTIDKLSLESNIDTYNNLYGMKKNKNDYSGIFKDKNVIMIMMESIDSWIIDEETMPTLSNIMQTGLNFTNRYSPFFNGGQTINSEFALNTGMYAISSKKTIYDIDDVDYTYSIANMLKKNGYKVNSFHANTGSFYNRTSFHKLLGYDRHYSALDMQKVGLLDSDKNYFSDSTFIGDDYLFDLMTSGNKFFTFYTTYSAHLSYDTDNRVYKTIEHPLIDGTYNTEEEYIYRTLANDTDKALKILIDKLTEKGLIDNTVIVLASDHYSYGYSNSDYVALKKGVNNDRKELQNTPFVIWTKDMQHKDIDTILDTADIVPTLLNMLDIDYEPNKYMGEDVFSDSHDEFVWFSDGSIIKGNETTLSDDAMLTKANYNVQKNKNILLTNYYGK